MDEREISRLNMRFGKFFDPILLLTTITVICISVLAVLSISPRTFSKQEITDVLGAKDESTGPNLELIRGEHEYFTSENLQKISDTHFKYSTFINKRPSGKISKPILKIQGASDTKIQIAYTNSNTSKIFLVKGDGDTSYLLQKNSISYSPNINFQNQSEEIYLLVENAKPIFFKQYVEINFFLNQ